MRPCLSCPAPLLGLVAAAVAGVSACESGVLYEVDIEIAEAARDDFVDTRPGLLVVELPEGGQRHTAAICGAAPAAISLRQDDLFSCMPREPAAASAVVAFISPIPEDWDADVFCALERAEDDGVLVDLATAAPADEAPLDLGFALAADAPVMGEGEGSWRRDLSPCGGVFEGSVTLAPR